ncbi:MAG: ABC transporter ATP-binding protein [Clostridia bacterium]|nr:ABC transporter ATP-binding protein [Clostridia bacterium]
MVIETKYLTKLYGNKLGCQDICLSVSEGQVFGFLGPNGAGKSTLVKILMGLITPTSGEARLLGRPLGDLEVRKRIGFLPENFRYQDWLTGYELLSFHADLYRLPPNRKEARIKDVLEMVGLTGREGHRIRTYSRGMQQRIGLASALLPDPDLLFLDEPTSALDPLGRKEVREIILHQKSRGKTVFLNSHFLSEVELVCDRVAIIKKSQVVAQGSLEELRSGNITLDMRVGGITEGLLQALDQMGCPHKREGEKLWVEVAREEDIPLVAQRVVQHGGLIYQLTPTGNSLENLFVNLVEEGGE